MIFVGKIFSIFFFGGGGKWPLNLLPSPVSYGYACLFLVSEIFFPDSSGMKNQHQKPSIDLRRWFLCRVSCALETSVQCVMGLRNIVLFTRQQIDTPSSVRDTGLSDCRKWDCRIRNWTASVNWQYTMKTQPVLSNTEQTSSPVHLISRALPFHTLTNDRHDTFIGVHLGSHTFAVKNGYFTGFYR